MARKMKALDDLFLDGLKDIYYAEKKILKALPKMAKASTVTQLEEAFLTHRDETEGQIERLEQVFEMLGKRPQGKTCDAIDGMIAEGEQVIAEYEGSDAVDAGLLAAAQAVEHYEISRYGTLKVWAKTLGMNEAGTLLDETLEEEKRTDKLLTKIAQSAANKKAGAGRRAAA
ncbi:ferritin-like domain-containing protein [Dongia soli]|uniref:Ferritin-like domain-containing protein n=1 Tax=Dongia soli TaxID=600628 RepID=A0ABU5EDX0_9PROT|nr:ferritin-like domain-containing protein [Dongia soli]MDY0884521.1 ferritin-like domain-containing protein [Dongia soli]